MNHQENNKQYSAEDIQRYLRGEMPAEEMHAMETAALDDPFLADAIEGFEMAMRDHATESLQSSIGKLNKEFSERVRKPATVVTFSHSRWWQISAAAVILVIIGFALYNNRPGKDERESSLAVIEKKQSDTMARQRPQEDRATRTSAAADSQINGEKKAVDAASPSRQADQVKNNDRPKNALSKERAFGVDNREEETKDDLKLERAETTAKRNQVAAPTTQKPVGQPDYDLDRPKSHEPLAARSNQPAGRLNNFSGRVVDPNNKPLPYASVQVMPDRLSVITDQTGNFTFSTKDSVVDVQVALTGFEQRNFRLQNSISPNNLVLEPSNQQLQEVVVSGYGNKRKKDASTISGKVQNAVPEIGWIEYEKYLDANKKIPPSNPQLKGEVVVSFEVKRPNTLSDFKIEKSLSKEHDREAIRLIETGPSWKLLNSRKTRITVIVKF